MKVDINKKTIGKAILMIGLLFMLANGYAQRDQWYLRHHQQYYPIADYPTAPMRAVNSSIIVDSDIDSVYIACGSGVLSKKRIRPNNVEEDKAGPFRIAINEFSDSLHRWALFLNSVENEHLQYQVRCFCSSYGTVPSLYTPDSCHCFSTHQQLADTDTCVLEVYSIVKDANVSTLRLFRKTLVLDSLIGRTDTCGLFTLDIPVNQETFFGFFLNDNYICWIRILVTKDGFIPQFINKRDCYRQTRKHPKRIRNFRKGAILCN